VRIQLDGTLLESQHDADYATAPTHGHIYPSTIAYRLGNLAMLHNPPLILAANALLLRPLPFADPSRLVLVGVMRTQLTLMSYLRFTGIREQNHSFSGIATVTTESFNFSGRGDAEEIPSARTTWNFFDVLGVRPVLGRAFVAGDDQPGGKHVALITHSFWMTRFGGAPGARAALADFVLGPAA